MARRNRSEKKTKGKGKRNKRDGAVPRRAGLREIKEIKFMRERDVEQKLRREVEKRGGRCFKFLSSVSGVPDRILLLPGGLVIFAELKKEGEKPRKLQEVQMRKIRELGFRVRVVDSEQEIQKLMREIEEEWKS